MWIICIFLTSFPEIYLLRPKMGQNRIQSLIKVGILYFFWNFWTLIQLSNLSRLTPIYGLSPCMLLLFINYAPWVPTPNSSKNSELDLCPVHFNISPFSKQNMPHTKHFIELKNLYILNVFKRNVRFTCSSAAETAYLEWFWPGESPRG